MANIKDEHYGSTQVADPTVPQNTYSAVTEQMERLIVEDSEIKKIKEQVEPLARTRLIFETQQKMLQMQLQWLEQLSPQYLNKPESYTESYSTAYLQELNDLISERITYYSERKKDIPQNILKEEIKKELEQETFHFINIPKEKLQNKPNFTRELEKNYEQLDQKIIEIMDEAESLTTRHGEIVEEWKQKKKDKLDDVTKYYQENDIHPFLKACISGDLTSVQRQLSAKKFAFTKSNLANSKDAEGNSVLQLACRNGHIDVVRTLLEAGANPNMPGKSGLYAVHEAVLSPTNQNAKAILQLLTLHKANLHARGRYGATALHFAALAGNIQVCHWLIHQNVNKNAQEKFGQTALHLAADKGHLEIITLLVAEKANPNIINRDGETPLLQGIIQGHLNVIDAFMEQGHVLSKGQLIQLVTRANEIKQPSLLDAYNKQILLSCQKHNDVLDRYKAAFNPDFRPSTSR